MSDSLLSLAASFPYAIATGLLAGIACALLGVFVILKRVVFIGIALSEIAACGIAGAMLAGLPPMAGALALTLLAAVLLAQPFEQRRIPRDALLGLLFVAAASASVLLVAHSGMGLQEIKALLYGDLLLATRDDTLALAAVLVPATTTFLALLRPILYSFLDRDAAVVLRVKPARWEALFFVLLGLVVAAASKTAGSLLVFCYLVVPASTALLLTRRLGAALLLAALFAAASTLLGLSLSFSADWPANPAICATACALLPLALLLRHCKPKGTADR